MKQLHLKIHQQLRRIAKSRWALSTVVTTLIVLVISVLLAGVVAYFAINVTSTRVQEESLVLAKQHIWFDGASGTSQAAIMIINTGGRDVVVDKLTVRGQECDWTKVFYNVTKQTVSGDLFDTSSLTNGATIPIGGSDYMFKQATSDLTLQSGATMIVYMSNPDSIGVNDIGLTVSINIFTSQAMYYKETNVQGTSGTSGTQTTSTPSNPSIPDDPGTSILEIVYAAAYYNSTGDDQIALVIHNPSSSSVDLAWDSARVNGSGVTGTWHIYASSSPLSADLPYYNAQPIQGHTLVWSAGTHTVSPGEWLIVYYQQVVLFGASDVGAMVEVMLIDSSSQNTNTKHITVQQA